METQIYYIFFHNQIIMGSIAILRTRFVAEVIAVAAAGDHAVLPGNHCSSPEKY